MNFQFTKCPHTNCQFLAKSVLFLRETILASEICCARWRFNYISLCPFLLADCVSQSSKISFYDIFIMYYFLVYFGAFEIIISELCLLW